MQHAQGDRIGGGEAVAALATMLVAALLVVVRGSVEHSVIVLVLAAVVSLAGSLGGWRSGVSAAAAAALSFNFLHTEPYLSLRIHDADDVLTTLTLLVVGAIAGVTSSVANRQRTKATDTKDELAAVERIADLVAVGADPLDVQTAVRVELLGLLGLSACDYEVGDVPDRSALGRGGALQTPVAVYHNGGFELPATGVVIPVLARGVVVGHLSCTPTPGIATTAARRRAAVTLADLLGTVIALGRSGTPARHN